MVAIGYLSVYAYSFVLIFILGKFISQKFGIEFSRKLIHILLFGLWVIIDLFFKNSIHQIIVPLSFLLINTLSYKFKFFKSIERTDNNHLGTIYFAIAITLILTVSYFKVELYPYTGIATLCLTFGDGFAGLFGYRFGSRKIRNNKSVIGTFACFFASLIGCLIYKTLYFPTIELYDILLISIIVSIVEMVDYGLDNFTVTLISFIISIILVNESSFILRISLLLAIIVFWLVFLSKSIDYYGAITSMIIVFCFSYYGNIKSALFLLICYSIIFIISFTKKKFYRQKHSIDEKHGKNIFQILANGIFGTLFIILYGLYKEDGLIIISYICIAGCFIDSISSDIGVLSKKRPYDFIKRKYIDTGLSGGVSILGILSAIIFTVIITSLIIILCPGYVGSFFLIYIIIFLQTIIDTCIGSLLQVKYKCQNCSCITEKRLHCNVPTTYYTGIKKCDNNCVNFLASLLVCIIACFALL